MKDILVLKPIVCMGKSKEVYLAVELQQYKHSPKIQGLQKVDFKVIDESGSILDFEFKEEECESYTFKLKQSNSKYIVFYKEGFQMDKIEL